MTASRQEARATDRPTETAARPPSAAALPAQRPLLRKVAVASEQIAAPATLRPPDAPSVLGGNEPPDGYGADHSSVPRNLFAPLARPEWAQPRCFITEKSPDVR